MPLRISDNRNQGSTAPTDAPDGIPVLSDVEERITDAARATWTFFHHVPIQGALASAGLGLYAASVFGVGELMAAGLTAYVCYRMFAYGEPLLEAVQKTIKFQKGELPIKQAQPKPPARGRRNRHRLSRLTSAS
ncbi:MAG TPA: hypothetical protein VFS39_03885 [Nitrospira sp.]|nr:hypothetical protein [Nitrospira sp.]